MICKDCAVEADGYALLGPFSKGSGKGHEACKGGTHCFCQHKTGPDLYAKEIK